MSDRSVGYPSTVRQALGGLAALAGGLLGTASLAASVPAGARANLRRDLVHAVLTGVFAGVIGYYAVVARRLGASELLLSLMVAGPYIGSVLGITAPYLLNTAQPARRLAAFWGVARLVWVAALFITAPGPFAVMVLAYMILAVLPEPGYVWTMQGAYPARLRGRLLGAPRSLMALGALVAAPVAGPLLDSVGYGPVLAAGGILGALGAWAFSGIRVLKPKPWPRQSPWDMARSALQNRSFRGYALAWNVMGLGAVIMGPAIPIVLVDRLDVSFTTVGVLTLVSSLATTVSYVVWGRLVDRWTGPHVTWASMALYAAVPLVFALAVLAGNVWVLLAAYLAMGIGGAGLALGWLTSLASMALPEQTASLATMFTTSIGLFGVGGPFIGGLLLLVGGPYAALGAALFLLLSGAALMRRTARAFQPVDEEPAEGAPA